MTTSRPHPERAPGKPQGLLALAACLLALIAPIALIAPAGAAAASSPTAPRAIASSLRAANRAHARADRAVVASTAALQTCRRRHPSRCAAQRGTLARARRQLRASEARLAHAAQYYNRGSHNGANGRGSSWRPSESPQQAGKTEGSSGKQEAPEQEAPKQQEAPEQEAGSEGGQSGKQEGGGEAASTGSGGLEMGLVAGSAISWELPWMEELGTHTTRMEFAINTPVSAMESTIAAYAKAGIRPLLLAGFYGRLPSSSEAQNLASWAAAFGPGGSFWKGKSYPASDAVTDIEFGNETSYSYQFSETANASNWYALPSYATRAQTYAIRFKEAVTAMQLANSQVGLLAQADDGGSGTPTWVDNMFAAVPNLAQLVAGWTVHPYGPHWEATINRLVASTKAEGASSSIPIYATEFGISSDNGRCLQENFGFNRCMTYGEAASTLETAISGMQAKYGSRLRALYVFQARDQDATGASTEREGYCGALQSNQASKGAYTSAVEKLLSANP
ncbi:MAG TPA: hypothetical protein VL972_00325 [Solirubrobacteraceae bacterium]|nr:hypothetical protein [Solirubrobacteraceae bacterium]